MNRYTLLATIAAVGGAAAFQGTFVNLQGTTPGTPQTGHLNITGTAKSTSMVAYNSTPIGQTFGGDFRVTSNEGRGILGNASSLTGPTYGGLFQSFSNAGRGIAGIAQNSAGTTYGGFFSSLSNQGRGVYGQATNATGTTYGVYGKAVSSAGYGVYSEGNMHATGGISGDGAGITNLNASNLTTGIVGNNLLGSNIARRDVNNLFSGPLNQFDGGFTAVGPRTTMRGTNEIFGLSSTSTTWAGTYITTGSGGLPYYGYDNVTHNAYTYLAANGVLQFNVGGNNRLSISETGNVGIASTTTPTRRLEVYDNNSNNTGAFYIQNGAAPTVTNPAGRYGIMAHTKGTAQVMTISAISETTSGASYALYGDARGPGINYGVSGFAAGGSLNYSGHFLGQIYADSANSGIKNFLIDHPLDPANKVLTHSSVESDERMNLYRGSAVTDAKGFATAKVPSWFDALNEDIQYQLTVIGDKSDNFVLVKIAQELHRGEFLIRTSEPNVKVNWQVSGRRHDPTSNHFPMEVERMKVEGEKGKYYVPEAYGKDKRFGIGYRQTEEASKQKPRS
ncbi:MAG: hypothetical protein ABL962_06655 [Fimbriimonadaceae bacterium]